ncbi:MAG: MarR family transcriptional regulator [Candidatus Kapabacteria bacterium]|jgi:DNA-binding MarR family transcriptional regulator|nr:MarR family transcriptional regulator [Candidatus Kapabacteria bacterium]
MPTIEKEITQNKFRNESHKAIINVIYTGNWLTAKHSKFLKKFDLTEQQFNILRILRGQRPKPASIGLLRDRMLDKMSDVSRLVERLRKLGLVEREVSPTDRRTVEIVITKLGVQLLSRIDRKNREIDATVQNLSEEELQQLNTLLDKLRG